MVGTWPDYFIIDYGGKSWQRKLRIQEGQEQHVHGKVI
jgi:hypothetical protein